LQFPTSPPFLLHSHSLSHSRSRWSGIEIAPKSACLVSSYCACTGGIVLAPAVSRQTKDHLRPICPKKRRKTETDCTAGPTNPAGIYYFYFRRADGRWRERSTGTRKYSEARDIRSAELGKIRKREMPSELRDWTLEKRGEGLRRSAKALSFCR
jgi:hypothetical protein